MLNFEIPQFGEHFIHLKYFMRVSSVCLYFNYNYYNFTCAIHNQSFIERQKKKVHVEFVNKCMYILHIT